MICIARGLIAITFSAITLPALAFPIAPGSYSGTLVCGTHLTNASPGWSVPVGISIDGDRVEWLRAGRDTRPEFANREFRETGTARLSSAGMGMLEADGSYAEGNIAFSKWKTRGTLRLLGQDFVADVVQVAIDTGATTRQCQARFVVVLNKAGARTISAAATSSLSDATPTITSPSPSVALGPAAVQPSVVATISRPALQELVDIIVPGASESFSAYDWKKLDAFEGVNWRDQNLTVDETGVFSRTAMGTRDGVNQALIKYFGVRTMVLGVAVSVPAEQSHGEFAAIVHSQFPDAGIRQARGPCPGELGLDLSSAFELRLPGKKLIYTVVSGAKGLGGLSLLHFKFILDEDGIACEQTGAKHATTVTTKTIGTPSVVNSEPSILNQIGWGLAGVVLTLALPALFLLASAGSHEELGLRIFFRNLNATGRIDPFRAQTEATLVLFVALIACLLVGPLIVWNKAISPSIQRNDARVQTICCLQNELKLSPDGRLAVEVVRRGSFLLQMIQDMTGGAQSMREYDVKVIDTLQARFIDLQGASGRDSTVKVVAPASVTPSVSFLSDRIQIIALNIGMPTRTLLHTIEARQIGLASIASSTGITPAARFRPSQAGPDSSTAEDSGFLFFGGAVEAVDNVGLRQFKVRLPFEPRIVKTSGESTNFFITKRTEPSFLGSLLSIATLFQETTEVAMVDALTSKVTNTDSFYGSPPQYIGSSSDGQTHFLQAGKYLKVFRAAPN